MKEFLKRKNIEISAKRYGIDALGAMAHGLFCSLLIGTIFKTLGTQLGIQMPRHGGGHRLCAEGRSYGALLSGGSGLGSQRGR